MSDSVCNEINNCKRFEECVAKIFNEAEYSTALNVVLEQNKGDIYNPVNQQKLRNSIERLEKGLGTEHDLVEVDE